jgi:hypothetical protein
VPGNPNPIRQSSLSPASVGTFLGKLAGSFRKGRGGHRIFQGVTAASTSFLQTLRRVGKVLWLEVTGFLFLWMALLGGIACWHEYHVYAAGKQGLSRAALAGLFALVFAYFGVSSFSKARRS